MIYIKDAKRLKNEKFSDFFNRVFLDDHYTPQTFYDKECLKSQCVTGKYRSFEDIVEIAKTYYPNISDKSVAKCIKENGNFSFLYCSGVKKWTMPRVNSNCGIPFLHNHKDCKNFTDKVGEKYSFDMIQQLMNK